MSISKWLDKQEAAGVDVSRIRLPDNLAHDEAPAETIFFREIRTCSVLCAKDHPFALVERFGDWYQARGRKPENGKHTQAPAWWFFTRDRQRAVSVADESLTPVREESSS